MIGRLRHRLAAAEIAWLGIVPAAGLLAAALLWLAPPLSSLYPDPDYPFYAGWDSYVHREPLESTRVLLALAVPLLLAAAVLALGAARPRRGRLTIPVIAVQVAVVAFVAWSVAKQRDNDVLVFLGQFNPTLLPKRTLYPGPVIGLALLTLALSWDASWMRRIRGLAARLGSPDRAVLALAGAFTAIWLLPAIFTESNLAAAGLIPHSHLPWQLNELAAAVNGRTPLVDYVPAYSVLLPIALSPAMGAFDSSITSFTLIMSGLSLLALLAVYGAFREVTGRAWTALALYAPFVALTLQPWWTHEASWQFNANYYPVMPQRYLAPFVLAWLLARHLRRGSPPVWVLGFAAGIGLFVNVEFGAPALLAVAVALLVGAERRPSVRAWVRAEAPRAALGLAGAVALVYAVILVRSGELADPALLTYFARIVARGLSLTAMPEWGLHWALYLTYAAALLTAAVRHVNCSPDRTLTGMLAFAGIFGIATAGYFGGRSMPWQLWGLFGAWALALSLLAWSAWLALRSARGDRVALRRIAVSGFAALAGFGVMVASINRTPAPWKQLDRISSSGPDAYADLDRQRFIEGRTEPGEAVLIVGVGLEHRSAERAGVENLSPWYAYFGFASPRETERALDQLEAEGGEVVFIGFGQAEQPPGGAPGDDEEADAFGLGAEIGALLRERGYARVGRDPASAVVEWRRGPDGSS